MGGLTVNVNVNVVPCAKAKVKGAARVMRYLRMVIVSRLDMGKQKQKQVQVLGRDGILIYYEFSSV